jgi:hypothetical protein
LAIHFGGGLANDGLLLIRLGTQSWSKSASRWKANIAQRRIAVAGNTGHAEMGRGDTGILIAKLRGQEFLDGSSEDGDGLRDTSDLELHPSSQRSVGDSKLGEEDWHNLLLWHPRVAIVGCEHVGDIT